MDLVGDKAANFELIALNNYYGMLRRRGGGLHTLSIDNR